MFVCVCVYTHTHTHIYTYIYIYLFIYIYIYAYIRIYTHTQIGANSLDSQFTVLNIYLSTKTLRIFIEFPDIFNRTDPPFHSLNAILAQSKNCPFGVNTMIELNNRANNIRQDRHLTGCVLNESVMVLTVYWLYCLSTIVVLNPNGKFELCQCRIQWAT